MPPEQITDSWFFSSNDEGIFVKVNDLRVKNRQGRLMEDVIDVKDAGNAQKTHIVVSLCLFVITACMQTDQASRAHLFSNIVLLEELRIRVYFYLLSLCKLEEISLPTLGL